MMQDRKIKAARTPVAASIGVAAAQRMRADQRHDLAVVETHSTEKESCEV